MGLPLSDNMQLVWDKAHFFQNKYKADLIHSEALLYGLLVVNCEANRILARNGITLTKILHKIEPLSSKGEPQQGIFSTQSKTILKCANDIMHRQELPFITSEQVLYGIIIDEGSVAHVVIKEYAEDFAMLEDQTIQAICKIRTTENFSESLLYDENFRNLYNKNTVRKTVKYQASYTPQSIAGTPLDGFGYDLTQKARNGKIEPIIGRDDDILRVEQTLSRKLKSCPLLIGEPGIGKTAVVEGLALKIVQGDVPFSLQNKVIFSLDLSGLVAGATYQGEFEERFKKAIDYVKSEPNIILFIDEIHNMMGAGNGIKAPEMLKPSLARGELQIIGATTISEYRQFIEKDAALERRFQTIMLEPPSVDDCIRIIQGIKDGFETHHNVTITDEAIIAAVKLSERYITDRFLPDKAIDLIDEAAAHRRLIETNPSEEVRKLENRRNILAHELDIAKNRNMPTIHYQREIAELDAQIANIYNERQQRNIYGKVEIGKDDIANIISQLTSIPVAKLTEDEADRLLKLEDVLHERVIGQDEAVTAVAKAIRRARAYVKDENRPIGSFIFVGPTGVGKTELSKALAECVFGSEKMLVRIDMSEYMEKASVSKLIGAPPGYVGYEEQGQLTEKIRRKPFSVVLFDEIEKAHVDVFNLMLQILDDGRLTDSKGRVVDFKNTIIIMTSNAGAAEARDDKGFGFGASGGVDSVKEKMLGALKRHFKPEFLNRVDDIIVFKSLSKEECGEIVDIMCKNLIKRLKDQGIELEITYGAKEFLVEKGYDEEYGARPLRRVVQTYIEDAISEIIISGKIGSGWQIMAIANETEIYFTDSDGYRII